MKREIKIKAMKVNNYFIRIKIFRLFNFSVLITFALLLHLFNVKMK